jgi:hypothetical protein
VPAAEDVERQVTPTIVIAVEEAALLMAVQGASVASRSSVIAFGRSAWASRNSSTKRSSIA